MQLLKKKTLRTKLLIGFAVPIALSFVIAAVIFTNINSLMKANFWVNHTHEVIAEGRGLLGSMIDMETGMRGYLVAGKEEYLEPYVSGNNSFTININKLKQTVSDNNKQVQRLLEVEKLSNNWLNQAAKVQIDMRKEVEKSHLAVEEFQRISARTVGKEKFDALRGELAKIDLELKNHDDLQGQFILQGMLLDMINQETGQRGFLLSGQEASLDPFKEGIISFERHLDLFRKHLHDVKYSKSNIQAALNHAVIMAADWQREAAIPEIEARRVMNHVTTSMNDITKFIDKGIGKQSMDQLRLVVAKFIHEEKSLNIVRIANANNIGTTTILMTLISALVSALLVTIVANLIIKSIRKDVGGEPIEIAKSVRRIAKGDLRTEGSSSTGKESGIYLSMLVMSERLRLMVSDIATSANSQSVEASELSIVAKRAGRIVKQQYVLMDEISEAIEGVGTNSNEMANQTDKVASSADEAKQLVDDGTKKSEIVSENIMNLSSNLNDVSNVIEDLEQSVAMISNILAVINGIADQTNLLALNAAIEAARAGSQGKGFAVVADEVRVLAKNTQNSTTEIEEMVVRVQKGTQASVQAMLSGKKQAENIVLQTNEMKGVLIEISSSVHNITDMASQIAIAAKEQSAAVKEVNSRASEVRDLTEKTGKGSDQINSSTERLTEMSAGLTGHVNQFKM